MNYDASPITRRQTISRDEPWRNYGHEEPVIKDFICRYTETSLSIKTADITSDGELVNGSSITNYESLNEFTGIHPDPEKDTLRIILVEELSAEGLQILSTNLGIHSGFWRWVASDQASDGFWLNTNNDGKILSFDLPCFEFYSSHVAPSARVVREGRLKQLSSRHRLFGSGLSTDAVGYEVYVNRRVSAYLIPMNGAHTFVFLSEDCLATSSFPMCTTPKSDPISAEWLLQELRSTEPSRRRAYTKEPPGLILAIITKLLETWHLHTVYVQHDLDNIDSSLPESLPDQLSEHNLYDIGTYLHRDTVQTLFRFAHQLEKYEGYLKYLTNVTKDHFRPKEFMHDVGTLSNNIVALRRRLDTLKERGNMSLTLVNNYITLQQARQTRKQAQIQLNGSQSAHHLSVVATLFLPLSFASSWLSINGTTPIWVFAPVAIGSIAATAVILKILEWSTHSRSRISRVLNKIIGRQPSGIQELPVASADTIESYATTN